MENKNNESIENTENSTENIESTEYTESVETTENTENTENTEPAKGGHDLGTGSIGKLMLKMAIPTIIAQIINMLNNVVDRMYIGHIPDVGGIALTGVGVTFPIIVIITAFSALVGMGGAPRAAISMGQGDNKTAEKIMGNCSDLDFCGAFYFDVRRKPGHNFKLRNELHQDLCAWNYICPMCYGNECVYHNTGLFYKGNADNSNRSGY